MNDPAILALHFQARAATEAAKPEHRRFLDNGAGVPWNGPISKGIISILQDRTDANELTFCEDFGTDKAARSFWVPSQPQYLRCESCFEAVIQKRVIGQGYQCDGCGAVTRNVGEFMGLIDAQVLPEPKPWVVGPVLVAFVLCAACQRADYDGR